MATEKILCQSLSLQAKKIGVMENKQIDSNGAADMKRPLGFYIGRVRLLWSRVVAELYEPPIGGDPSAKALVRIVVLADTKELGLARDASPTTVLCVDVRRNVSQVSDPVIERVTVYVVNDVLWPCAIEHEPANAVDCEMNAAIDSATMQMSAAARDESNLITALNAGWICSAMGQTSSHRVIAVRLTKHFPGDLLNGDLCLGDVSVTNGDAVCLQPTSDVPVGRAESRTDFSRRGACSSHLRREDPIEFAHRAVWRMLERIALATARGTL